MIIVCINLFTYDVCLFMFRDYVRFLIVGGVRIKTSRESKNKMNHGDKLKK